MNMKHLGRVKDVAGCNKIKGKSFRSFNKHNPYKIPNKWKGLVMKPMNRRMETDSTVEKISDSRFVLHMNILYLVIYN